MRLQTRSENGQPYSVEGATDLHVHCGPEGLPRRFDPVQLAQHVAEFGLKSLVLKSHFASTSAWAQIAYRLTGVRLFGSVTLNHYVGGINPLAIRAALGPADEAGSFLKIVWLPTIHAAAHLTARHSEGEEYDIPPEWAGGVLPDIAERIDSVQPISLIRPDVQDALETVLRLIAQHQLVLATGHAGREEIFHIVERARALGVDRMVVTHAQYDPPALTVAEMQALAAKGAYIELSYILIDMGLITAADAARAIRTVGAQRIILSSDLGQVNRRSPAEGLAQFGELLLKEGVDREELDLTMKHNPWHLLSSSQ